ncbi:MAG: type II secretion system protein GspC [Gammaproteobacteria bacterium]|nr:type II secretion system protein GspC [Gammaproteobacteria bacterium]
MQGQLIKATQEWASLFTNLQWQKIWRVAPKWITVVLVVLVAKSAADLTWLVFAPSEQGVARTSRSQSALPVTQAQVRLRTVGDLHLFGVAPVQPVASEAPIEAKKTGLKLTLRGVFAAGNPAQAMAIIADARGQEKVYQKNDTIFSGVTLYAVYPDRVILERSGNFEMLSLPRDEDDANANGVQVIHHSSYTPPEPAASEPPVQSRTIQGGKELEAFRDQLTQNPQEFWKNARIEPAYDSNNQIVGYRFDYNNRQIMQAMGLRPGDIIVEVNGQAVSDPSTLTGLLGQLSTASSFSLVIERNGQRENLNINL